MKIMAADLWPIIGGDERFGEAADVERLAAQMRLQQLVENLLLYDQVIVPTDNWLSLKILADTFGAENIALLIDEGLLKFVRFHGFMAYVGKGFGVSALKVDAARTPHIPTSPMWQPNGVAAYSILREVPGVEDRRARQIAQKVISATKDVELESFRVAINDAVGAAVKSPSLDPSLKITAPDLMDLPGKADNQIIIPIRFREPLSNDNNIAKCLRIARTELEILAQKQAGCEDLSTLSPVGKLPRSPSGSRLRKLCEITEVPDVGAGVIEGNFPLHQIVALRNSRHWPEFTRWFHEECATDPARVGKEYVRLLKQEGRLDTPFLKTVRLLVTTAIGFIFPPAGIAASAADAFLLPHIKEPSPKYFVEDLEQLTREQVAASEKDRTS